MPVRPSPPRRQPTAHVASFTGPRSAPAPASRGLPSVSPGARRSNRTDRCGCPPSRSPWCGTRALGFGHAGVDVALLVVTRCVSSARVSCGRLIPAYSRCDPARSSTQPSRCAVHRGRHQVRVACATLPPTGSEHPITVVLCGACRITTRVTRWDAVVRLACAGERHQRSRHQQLGCIMQRLARRLGTRPTPPCTLRTRSHPRTATTRLLAAQPAKTLAGGTRPAAWLNCWGGSPAHIGTCGVTVAAPCQPCPGRARGSGRSARSGLPR